MAAQQITCPWAKKSIPTPCSFQQVMSEQLALEFQEGLEDIEPQRFILSSHNHTFYVYIYVVEFC